MWDFGGLLRKVGQAKETIIAFVTQQEEPEAGAQLIINAVTPTVTKLPQIATKATTEAISLREI